jgi:hypothetical protein
MNSFAFHHHLPRVVVVVVRTDDVRKMDLLTWAMLGDGGVVVDARMVGMAMWNDCKRWQMDSYYNRRGVVVVAIAFVVVVYIASPLVIALTKVDYIRDWLDYPLDLILTPPPINRGEGTTKKKV